MTRKPVSDLAAHPTRPKRTARHKGAVPLPTSRRRSIYPITAGVWATGRLGSSTTIP